MLAALACQGFSESRGKLVLSFFTSFNTQRFGAAQRRLVLFLKISAMDLSAQKTMKSAANCDKQCELQIFEKHQNLERALRFRVTLVSNSASVSSHSTAASALFRQCVGVALDEEWQRLWLLPSLHLDLRNQGRAFSVLLT